MNEPIISEYAAILFCIFSIRIMRVPIDDQAATRQFESLSKTFFGITFQPLGLFSMKEARREIKIIAGAAFGLPALESKCHRNVLEQIQMNFKYFPISFCLHFPLFTFLLGRRRILTRRIISALLWGDSFQWGFPTQPASKWTQTEMISRFILLEWQEPADKVFN